MLQRQSSTVFDALKTPRPPQFAAEDDLRLDEPLTARARAEGDTEACCYRRVFVHIMEGRPLRVGGEPVLPSLRGVPRQADPSPASAAPADCDQLRDALLQVDWLRSAQHEHASTGSFMRFALDLLALGAPRSLVADALIAARQELVHAELCLDLARLKSGVTTELGRLRLPAQLSAESMPDRLLRVARELLIDGALGEGEAALEAFERADRAPLNLQPRLRQLARDETEHALLGWRSLAWLVAQHPALGACLRGWALDAAQLAVGSRRALIREVINPGLELLLADVWPTAAVSGGSAPLNC